jgi:hypothetical protein
MTRKISYITGIAGAALVLAAPAFGKPTPSEPQWQQAIEARSQALNRQYQLGDFAKNNAFQSSVGTYPDAGVRAGALSQTPSVSTYQDAGERGGLAKTAEPQWLVALQARSEGMNRIHRIGEYAPYSHIADVDRSFVDNPSTPVPVVTADDGLNIDWPQAGLAFGLGIALALGLGLTVRMRRPPLAH